MKVPAEKEWLSPQVGKGIVLHFRPGRNPDGSNMLSVTGILEEVRYNGIYLKHLKKKYPSFYYYTDFESVDIEVPDDSDSSDAESGGTAN